MGRSRSGRFATLEKAGTFIDTSLDEDIHSAMPTSKVPVPSVTTIEATPTLMTKNALMAPATKQSAKAKAHAHATFQLCSETSTGTVVAESPIIEAIDKSNSPTESVIRAATPRNTRVDCDPKMAWKADSRPKVSGRTQ